ncbi:MULTISPECIES: ABC transporter permease [Devosia]|uniref:Glutathione transport system permease protein GsiD n=1 Tax=Devosia equisanguinis TaxID=2490941 RepID=A0A447I6Y9_9HYPH|nr:MULTISPECIES: ABC transporter permease [Devosia]ODT48105.1 MAG: peptide ABC transporter permease [Pelagibacterium sp. SCN 63-126]ODU83214.1 MAG: peptide ABC transporter permease [Pelagibacterium sp. SCN 63-17]OJX42186.1 MAG: peptide ABC transporter permease [Devosia sp. 63-57]VDS03223.1 Glutathione transport system permease protein GsiD [Devosia equisanguinis]
MIRLFRSLGWIGFGPSLLVSVVILAIVGLVWTPFDPNALDFAHRYLPPALPYVTGTDHLGRDLFSRLLLGASTSAAVSGSAVIGALLIGSLLGAISGYFMGWPDRIAMLVMDAILAMPGILLALAIMTVTGPSVAGLIGAMAVTFTPVVFRVVRSTVLSLREKEFIEASRALGNRDFFTIAYHILPNCVAPLTVVGTSLFGSAVLTESALSFLGLGVPPHVPTWGAMLSDGRNIFSQAPWAVIYPGLAISYLLLGVNLTGDRLRDLLDPRVKGHI